MEQLIRQYRESEGAAKERVREQIVREMAGYVGWIAAKHQFPGESIEDFKQEGYLGLLAALESYRPESGAAFTTYACIRITGQIKHYIRDRLIGNSVPRRDQLPLEEWARDPNARPWDERVIEQQGLSALLARLSAKQQQAVRLHYLELESYTDIARRLGISINYARHLVLRGMARLQKLAREEELHDSG